MRPVGPRCYKNENKSRKHGKHRWKDEVADKYDRS